MSILTIPERLKIMAMDSYSGMQFTTHYFTPDLDSILQRPAVIISIEDADYPATASNMERPVSNYTLDIVGMKLGQGSEDNHEAEIEIRTIVNSVLQYFLTHNLLQFSNTRGLESSPLVSLSGVEISRIKRGAITLMSAGEGQVFWGCKLSLMITENVSASEVIIPNLS